jgi:ArsR family metal-binding transcriptional regulator
MQNKTKYVPSIFDLSITDSIEYLVKNKSEHQLFRTAKELLEELSVSNTSYISIRDKKRGYTKNQIPHIISILSKKYGVSEEWLRFRKGNIMATPISNEGKKAMSFDAAMNEIEKLKIELQHKIELLQNTKSILEESREMVRQQQQLIKKLSK